MTALLVLVSLLVAGCAAAGWTRPNTTEAEIRRDSYECERDQRMVGGSFQNPPPPPYGYPPNAAGAMGAGFSNMGGRMGQGVFIGKCMESKGYSWTNAE
jgi:hypothetical protein